ncbi:MAG TPA: MerR family transcriptional regulator [Gaiellaceae bacterium]|jgi:DNA-binding transcriptional MerR regulator|nr:MerR family transcriptional regulator [Gaiellaceae bacterium]
MTSTAPQQPQRQQRERLLRIGEVVRRLRPEFPDISISKIRYLEDEGLLTPRRTQGGYRLFSEGDLERLDKILRLQRDEFLPLRVIKEELDAPGASERKRRRPTSLGQEEDAIDFDELCERAGVTPELAKELEDYGLLAPHGSGADKRYPESDADVAATCAQLVRYGAGPRNLRTIRTATGRQAALLEQLVGPALRGRNLERRAQALRDLQQLADLAGELSSLLFRRDLRDLAL